MTRSQEALIIYIFHPMLPRPIGMIKVNTRLVRCVSEILAKHEFPQGSPYAKAFSTKDEKATPFARIE